MFGQISIVIALCDISQNTDIAIQYVVWRACHELAAELPDRRFPEFGAAGVLEYVRCGGKINKVLFCITLQILLEQPLLSWIPKLLWRE